MQSMLVLKKILPLLLLFCFAWPVLPVSAQSKEAKTPEKQVDSFTLTPEKYVKAMEYRRARYTLYFIGVAYSLILLWMMIRYGVAARFRDLAESISGTRFV